MFEEPEEVQSREASVCLYAVRHLHFHLILMAVTQICSIKLTVNTVTRGKPSVLTRRKLDQVVKEQDHHVR